MTSIMSSDAAVSIKLVCFTVAGERFGLGLDRVERVLSMVALSPLPGGPNSLLGVFNMRGRIVPVLDIRRRLGLPGPGYSVTSLLVVARTRSATVALPVDAVTGVREFLPDALIATESLILGVHQVKGIIILADGLLFVQDLDAFLSSEEERQLAEALGVEQE